MKFLAGCITTWRWIKWAVFGILGIEWWLERDGLWFVIDDTWSEEVIEAHKCELEDLSEKWAYSVFGSLEEITITRSAGALKSHVKIWFPGWRRWFRLYLYGYF